MSTPVSPVTSVQHDAPPVQVQAKPPQHKPQTTNNDTVEISSAARSASAQKPESHAQQTKHEAAVQQSKHQASAQQAAAKAYKK